MCDHEYYGPLIDSYTKSILKSGLLLDEDLEALLSISKFRHFPERSGYKPSLSLLASIISALGSTFLAKKLKMPSLAVPPVIVSLYFIIFEYKNKKREQDDSKAVDKLLEAVTKIQKLTKNITRYMTTRYDLGKKDKNSLLLHGRSVEEFMDAFLQNSCDILEFLTDNLKSFTAYSTELKEDFMILEHLDYSSILAGGTLGDIQDCVTYTQKTYDINVLIFSKLLTYVGVLFNSQSLRESSCRTLLNETLPEIQRTLQRHHDKTKRQFMCLRHSANKKTEIQLQSETGRRKHISSKLEATLISSVNNLSVILEKSQNILERLEGGTMENSTEIGSALVDLRNHTFATYESLDLLCKLYGILSNSNIQLSDPLVNTTKKTDTTSSEAVPTVSYDDDTEPIEEKFELYIGVEESTDGRPVPEHEDHSSAYLSLMLRELRQSLKQHERFIAAKNKRGDEDEEETEEERRHVEKEQRLSPPKFNLKQLKVESDQKYTSEKQSVIDEKNKVEVVPSLPAPPPPPPLPSFTLSELEQETGQINARSMLENIKVLSSQINVQEEVFGDSDEDIHRSD